MRIGRFGQPCASAPLAQASTMANAPSQRNKYFMMLFPRLRRFPKDRLQHIQVGGKAVEAKLEFDGRGRPERRDFADRSADRAACRDRRAMPKGYSGFQG